MPLGHEGDVHLFGRMTPSPLVFGFADLRPLNHIVLLLITLPRPEEPGLVLSNILMEGFVQTIESH